MKKRMILLTALVLFGTAGLGWAQEGVSVQGDDGIGIDFDATWVSKYIWRGFDRYDDKAAFQPSVNFDLGSGLSFNVWSSFAGASGNSTTSTVDGEEWRYRLTYASSAFEGEAFRTNWALSYIFYDFPDATSKNKDLQEYNLALSWPDICSFGVVPSYTFVQMWPSEGGGAVRDWAGFLHIFGLGYDIAVAELANPLSFSAAAVYNDGTGGDAVDHDWSHIVWGLATSFDCGGGTFRPGLYYQTSMDDSVNPEDELWTSLSYGFSF